MNMQLKSTLLVLVFPFLLLVGFGCGGDAANTIPPEQMIAKSWKLVKLDMKSQLVGPEMLGNASFTFFKNGRYEILMGDLERGKWSLSPDKKVLITEEDDTHQIGEMDIVTLTPTKLVLTNTGNANPMTMELAPFQ
jgi:hypothetical protein